jgi:predicted nucleotidyltransferase
VATRSTGRQGRRWSVPLIVTYPAQPSLLLDALRRAGEEFDRRSLAWALVGGLAVSIRAEPRFTRDVDVAVDVVDDAAAEALVSDLRAQGYGLATTLEQVAPARLATVRLTPPGSTPAGVVLDVLFASSGVEPDICQAAEPLEVAPGLIVPVARAGHLVAMKLLSRADHRLQDEIDLRHLASVLTAEDIELARRSVSRIEALGAHRGRQLGVDLAKYLAAFARGPA